MENEEELRLRRCKACREDAPPATQTQIEELKPQIPDWQITTVDAIPRLERRYAFPDFVSALDFANKVGVLAEEEGHHPLITIEWGKVLVAWWTHKIRNIHHNDLIMAAKTDELWQQAGNRKQETGNG